MMPRSGSPWVKQGETIRSLYSLPVTRTSPSGQKYCSPSKLTSRSGSSESPARNGDPLVFQAVKSASLFGSKTAWHCPQTRDWRPGSSRFGLTMVWSA